LLFAGDFFSVRERVLRNFVVALLISRSRFFRSLIVGRCFEGLRKRLRLD
jgi:hypothetical protein